MTNRFEREENPNRRTPELKPPLFNEPVWWHRHGEKMRVVEGEFGGEFRMKSNAAEITIAKDPQIPRWNVDWKVKHTRNCYAQGRTEWQDEELEGAFGLLDSEHLHGGEVLKQFGGDSAEQGGYIRWKNYLNIPNPGTGHDFDPNVSILLTEDMIFDAQKFMQEHKGLPKSNTSSVPTTIAELLKNK